MLDEICQLLNRVTGKNGEKCREMARWLEDRERERLHKQNTELLEILERLMTLSEQVINLAKAENDAELKNAALQKQLDETALTPEAIAAVNGRVNPADGTTLPPIQPS